MKTPFFVILLVALTGCSSLPKDSLVRGLKVGGTPWSPTLDAEAIATGKAAANLTAEERREMLKPKTTVEVKP